LVLLGLQGISALAVDIKHRLFQKTASRHSLSGPLYLRFFKMSKIFQLPAPKAQNGLFLRADQWYTKTNDLPQGGFL
jgi:hypothetical protein